MFFVLSILSFCLAFIPSSILSQRYSVLPPNVLVFTCWDVLMRPSSVDRTIKMIMMMTIMIIRLSVCRTLISLLVSATVMRFVATVGSYRL